MDKGKIKRHWTYALWIKMILAVICALSATAMLISTIGTVLLLKFPDYEQELQAKYENVSSNYSAYALQLLTNGYTPEEVQKTLAKKAPNFQFGIVQSQEDHLNLNQIDLQRPESWLIGSPEDAEKYKWSFDGAEGMDYVYSLDDVRNGNLGSFYAYGTFQEGDGYEAEVNAIIYDPASGLFYLQSENVYYPLSEADLSVEVPLTWNLIDQLLQEAYGTSAKAADPSTQEKLAADPNQILSEADLDLLDQDSQSKLVSLFSEGLVGHSETEHGIDASGIYGTLLLHASMNSELNGYEYSVVYNDNPISFPDTENLKSYAEYWITAAFYDNDGTVTKSFGRMDQDVIQTESQADVIWERAPGADAEIVPVRETVWNDKLDLSSVYVKSDNSLGTNYWVLSWLPVTLDLTSDDLFVQWFNLLPTLYGIAKWCLPIQIISLIILVIAVILLASTLGHRREDDEIHLRVPDRIPYLLWILFTGIIELILVSLVWYFIGNTDNFGFMNAMFFSIETTMAGMLLGEELVATTIVRIKAKVFWRYTLWQYISAPLRRLADLAERHISLFIKLLLLIGGVTLLELLIVLAGISVIECGSFCFMLFILVKIAEGVVLLLICLQMVCLHEGSKKMAAGDPEATIDTIKLKWKFKEHGENLNHISDSIEAAVAKEMKSEHFQTELITNVSHDIKTPLTSIINYVDLMKKEEITNPKMQEYVDVLDRQSGKLKKLIEDLMEASKASTGNLTVNLEETDAAILLQQAVGEFEEGLNKNNLQIVVKSPEPPVTVIADGRHLWRVFDNLLGNICKYALPGSRVYIDLTQKEGKTTIVFRNISAAQLNITGEELMARFVRGDISRNTEGSGLGLNIAQSLMTLMKGSLQLEVDGDLFKVTLEF